MSRKIDSIKLKEFIRNPRESMDYFQTVISEGQSNHFLLVRPLLKSAVLLEILMSLMIFLIMLLLG